MFEQTIAIHTDSHICNLPQSIPSFLLQSLCLIFYRIIRIVIRSIPVLWEVQEKGLLARKMADKTLKHCFLYFHIYIG